MKGQTYYLPTKTGVRGKAKVQVISTDFLGDCLCKYLAPEDKAGQQVTFAKRFLVEWCWRAHDVK